jgi:hypothetical protein
MAQPPRLSVGDLVRVDFCGRTGVITSGPVPVSMNGDIEYRVGLRWENGLISPSYNTDYLELISEAR